MKRKSFTSTGYVVEDQSSAVHFYTETIEVNGLSSVAFFEAGESYKGQRFYWQNREKTFTLVGLGHAHVITSTTEENRFAEVDQQWNELCSKIVNEEHDLQPILFGGFSFDPANKLSSEWDMFPSAYLLRSLQLVIRVTTEYSSVSI
jgi:menaquinone-specific isochorismate synthase